MGKPLYQCTIVFLMANKTEVAKLQKSVFFYLSSDRLVQTCVTLTMVFAAFHIECFCSVLMPYLLTF